LFPDNIDDQSPDIGGGEPVNSQDCAQIQQALSRLGLRIAVRNDVPNRVVRHLARNEQLVADPLRILVLGSRSKAGSDFGFIHRSDVPAYDVMPIVKVTGTLQGGAARCTISNGAMRPLAAMCPSRPFC
jgi:hypothetical protein